MTKHAAYHSLADALKAADYGILYVYVSSCGQKGWLSQAQLVDLEWYEKLVSVDRDESAGFVREVGADEPGAIAAIAHGFVAFSARSVEEFIERRTLVRPWVESLVLSYVKDGVIDPGTYSVPG
jgi:hypothetical protein